MEHAQHDHNHSDQDPRLRDMPFTVMNLPRMGLLGLIRIYQMTLSRGFRWRIQCMGRTSQPGWLQG